MSKPNTEWKVLPHSDLERLGENLYTVTGQLKMPLAESTRRMTLVVLSGGRLAIFSAIALAEPAMKQLEALGTPTFLIVPSAIHRLDVAPWKDRFPDITVIAPEGAKDKVGEIVNVDSTLPDLGDPRVELAAVPGTKGRELSMLVETETGKTLVVNDLIFNFPEIKGVAGIGLKLLGFGPGHPTIPKLVKLKLVKDADEMRAQLRAWANIAGLERILVAHGLPIDNPRETLLELAAA
jgi:hypothetical protein